MNLAHIHLLLNHFPTIGTIIGIGLFLVGLAAKNRRPEDAPAWWCSWASH